MIDRWDRSERERETPGGHSSSLQESLQEWAAMERWSPRPILDPLCLPAGTTGPRTCNGTCVQSYEALNFRHHIRPPGFCTRDLHCCPVPLVFRKFADSQPAKAHFTPAFWAGADPPLHIAGAPCATWPGLWPQRHSTLTLHWEGLGGIHEYWNFHDKW